VRHEVFISYSSQDKARAEAVCAGLEGSGLSCWMAPRDVLPGTSYEESIIRAINECQVFVLIYSAVSNQSPHVENEVRIAWTQEKPIIPFILESVPLSDIMNYYIGSKHWLDASSGPLDAKIGKLAGDIKQLIGGPGSGAPAAGVSSQPIAREPLWQAIAARARGRAVLLVASVAIVIALVVIIAVYANYHPAMAGPTPTVYVTPTISPTALPIAHGDLLLAPPGSTPVQAPGLPANISGYRLRITGGVNPNVTVTADDIWKMTFVRLDHVEKKNLNDINFVANYTGVPLVSILQVAGIPAGNVTFRVVSQDGYSASLSLRQVEYSILAFYQDQQPYDLDLSGKSAVKIVPLGLSAEFWIKVPVEVRIYPS